MRKKDFGRGVIALVMVLVMMMATNAYSLVNNNESNDPPPTRSTALTLNTKHSATLTAGSVHTYTFTSSATGYYVVETFGSTDTYGTLTGATSPIGIVTNDNSGEGSNFAIGFKLNSGSTATVLVRHYNATSGIGAYQIQVRRQRATMYGFNFGSGDIDTTSDVTAASPYTTSMGYLTGAFTGSNNKSHALATDTSTFTRINSEIFFISTHGHKSSSTDYGGSVKFQTDWLSYSDIPSMNNTKVAVWSACYSSVASSGKTSVAKQSVTKGARTAIGWSGTIGVSSAKTFTTKFFQELGNGKTINASATAGSNALLWPWDECKNYTVFEKYSGAGGTYLNTPAVNTKGISSVSREEFEADLLAYEYVAHKLDGDGIRYFKAINGILTNDFYDVFDDGLIIMKSINTITQEEVSSTKELQFSRPDCSVNNSILIEGNLGYLEGSYEHDVYVKMDGKVIPIKITYAEYLTREGVAYQDVLCINLLDNTFISYDKICTAEAE